MATGAELIAKERNEQIEKHGRSLDVDVHFNSNGELRMAATALIANKGKGDFNSFPLYWDTAICSKMMNKNYKERLIIAGALIPAEIDRIQTNE